MPGGGWTWLLDQVKGLVDQLFPPACPICRAQLSVESSTPFCPGCTGRIIPLPEAHCSCCALPFNTVTGNTHLCADCLRHPPPFTRVQAAGLYQGALKEAVQRFKYSGRIELDRSLARLLMCQFPSRPDFDAILPVPLHPRKLKARGYNQSLLLARELACNLQIPLKKAMLVRTHESHSQQGLSARERVRNMEEAFACVPQVKGLRLLLVDDVMTTGATLRACSAALLNAGALSVDGLVVARAPRTGG